MFFNDISWEIAKFGKQAGLRVQALPGISSIDVLPIQLGFDIGDLGVQILEATQLVLFQLELNPFLSTLILQVGEFASSSVLKTSEASSGRFTPLVSHLTKFFPQDHLGIFIYSTPAPGDPTIAFSTELGSIDKHANKIRPGMTLYIPRVGVPQIEQAVLRALGLK